MNVLIVNGSRADYGALDEVSKALKQKGIDVFFKTLKSKPAEDTRPYVVSAVVGVQLEVLAALETNPDLVIILGDRFEILGVATAAYLLNWPIAHLSGGDITEGSQDDSMRHAITKLSHLHFVTNEESARRVIQLGEEPWRVHNVGYPGVKTKIMPPDEAKRKAGILSYPNDFLLVVWHPNTTVDEQENLNEVRTLTKALDKVFKKTIIIGPNNDPGNDVIKQHLWKWAKATHNQYWDELPRDVYLGLLASCGCLVGNSSSGYYEAPTYGTGVVDIGKRQHGRTAHDMLIKCGPSQSEIVTHIEYFLDKPRRNSRYWSNPYENGDSASKIAEIILKHCEPKKLLRKKWHDTNVNLNNTRNDIEAAQVRVRVV